MFYYPINFLALICIIHLLFFNYKRGLYLLAIIIPCSSLFYRLPIPGVNITTLLVASAFIRAIYTKGFRECFGQGNLAKPILFLFVVVFVSCIGVYAFTSTPGYDLMNTITFAKQWFTYIFLYMIYVSQFDKNEDLKNLLICILLGITIQNTVAINELFFKERRRLRGIIGNPNELGSFFAAYIFICLFCYKYFSGILKVISSIGIISALVGLGFALSRGAYLAFCLGFTCYIWKKSKVLSVFSLIFIILFSGTLYGYLPEKIKYRIEMTFQDDIEEESSRPINIEASAYYRIPLALGGLKMFLESPIWGKGFGTFHLIGMDYYGNMGVPRAFVAHNMYIQILAELGIIGFIPFIIILYRNTNLGRYLMKEKFESPFLADLGLIHICINISLAVSCLFGNRLFNGNLTSYYWIFSAMVYKYSILMNNEIKSEGKNSKKM